MKTSKIPFYHVRPSCFKVPANTGPQDLDTLVAFYFLSNLQFEFLVTKTGMTNNHRLFNELSAGILYVAGRYETREKWKKKGIKSSLSSIHPKTQSSQASYAYLSAFLEDDVQRSGPEIVMVFSIVKHVCSSFHSSLFSPHQNESSWYVVRTLSNTVESKLHFLLQCLSYV